ncbi:hypothetical protein WN55_07150 [Dufourea novaeangliae]|uniref:Uncharacterized protein n=1 Tax=Dufourea novaeangliae TaxID=178035 RepID=A0A154P400_DUFNO|nr:hypothetical protein WN55_07150 [Dufourea novaeangliae]
MANHRNSLGGKEAQGSYTTRRASMSTGRGQIRGHGVVRSMAGKKGGIPFPDPRLDTTGFSRGAERVQVFVISIIQ